MNHLSKRRLKKEIMAEALRIGRQNYPVRSFMLNRHTGEVGRLSLDCPYEDLSELKFLCDQLDGKVSHEQ